MNCNGKKRATEVQSEDFFSFIKKALIAAIYVIRVVPTSVIVLFLQVQCTLLWLKFVKKEDKNSANLIP